MPKLEKFLHESKIYLDKLHFPIRHTLALKNNLIYFNSKQIDTLFSESERRVVKLLIQQRGRITSFDKVAEIVWSDQVLEKYSLFALAKIVQNIRTKLYSLGINHDIIKTIRKHGYLLLQ
jgi:DNA-binding winged helix-turn-helix (wHTH) protein